MAEEATNDNWWDFIPGASALVRLVGTTIEINRRGLALVRSFQRDGWTKENFGEFVELHRIAMSSYNDVAEVMAYSMLLAATIATGQITKSIESGKLKILLDTRLGQALTEAYGWVNQIKGKVEKEVERIKGELDWKAIGTALDHLQIAHNVGLTFSARYRDAVEDFYRNTADLSRQVFGPANSLFHGLSLLQLVVNDTTRLNGRTAADGQAEYLQSATDASRRVADKSREYARDGSKFWADFQVIHIQPQINAQYQGAIRRDSLIGRIDTTAKAARDSVKSVSDGFRDYRDHLAPFLSDENRENLRKIQQGFNRDIRAPVVRFQGFMATNFPNIQEHVEQLEVSDKILAEGVLLSLQRTADPSTLTDGEKIDQGRRVNSIMDNAMVVGVGNSGAPTDIRRDMIIVTSIYDRLGERWR